MAILAGKFHTAPASMHVLLNGRVSFLDAANNMCWSDPQGRVLVPDQSSARLLLRKHGYVVGNAVNAENGTVYEVRPDVPVNPTPPATPVVDTSDEYVQFAADRLREGGINAGAELVLALQAKIRDLEGIIAGLQKTADAITSAPPPAHPKGRSNARG